MHTHETEKKIGLFLLVLLLNSVGYKLAQILQPTGFLVTTWLDSFIPFVAYFVVPYALYAPVVLMSFFLYWNDYKGYRTMSLSFATVLAISIVIYLTFQTTITRAQFTQNDIFTWGVSLVYEWDQPINALPSLHVALPTLATLFVYLKNKKLGILLVPVTLLIILSTVFIKQHAVVDVIAGLILAFAVFKCRHLISKK